MKIEIFCHDGSPLGVTTRSIYGDDGRVGVGGAELALLTMCEEWHKAGHQVILYNDPKPAGVGPFEQRNRGDFRTEAEHDVVIVFRSPTPRIVGARGLKIWWSCDQYTVGHFGKFASQVDKIVLISPFHQHYFKEVHGIDNTIVIDLPVRIHDYEQDVEKVKGRMLFSSVPDRGLEMMNRAWPIIHANVPNSSLVITSDYRLWGTTTPGNERFRSMFMRSESVTFLGGVPRRDLIRHQLEAELQPYPCNYDELFCIAIAEAEIAGAYPVTSTQGSLATTNMGTLVGGNPRDPRWAGPFAERVIEIANDKKLKRMREQVRKKALKRFHPDTVLAQWDEKVFS